MHSSERVLYPMLGVGAFFIMFWVGFVVGYELGWTCNSILLNAFMFGCLGAYFIARLEVREVKPRNTRVMRDSGKSAPALTTPGGQSANRHPEFTAST